MFCPYCGKETESNNRHCSNCGSLLPESGGNNYGGNNTNNSYNSINSGSNDPYFKDPYNNNRQERNASTLNNTGAIVFSIFILLCCFMPLGIAGLVFAITAKSAPTYEEGEQKLKTSKMLNIIGLVAGIIIEAIYLVLTLSGVLTMFGDLTAGFLTGF